MYICHKILFIFTSGTFLVLGTTGSIGATTGLSVSTIIIISTLGVRLFLMFFKHYEEMEFDEKKMLLRIKRK